MKAAMYDLIKSLTPPLLMPLPISMALLFLGLGLVWLKRLYSGRALSALGLTVLLLASWAPIAERLLAPIETRYPALLDVADVEAPAAIVVLGGGWQPQALVSSVAKLSESSALRLMEGIRLWRELQDVPLVVSGAARDTSIAPVARGYLEAAHALGVPRQSIRVLDWPTDTGQEARAVRDLVGEGAPVILVTSASHMPRAMRHFQAVGLLPVAAPTHFLTQFESPHSVRYWIPSASQLHKTERALYETLGLLMVDVEH
ncbi:MULTISPECIES: ElyC/SanA/YdcF family protein [unclassified Halomonas]|uniref:ElyC/SanA/YdcF family protein n=2 Tax=Halomonas TaxID=2745 RepID=UPI0021E4077D|nr:MULTISPECIES: ElyC/SanA/YdcF family protein [unclassified Halomonas]UYF99260.1 YdcF family protein [Halomonas sp. GD1P12]WNL39583.1 ElyC/SanA/YdcF family protein [Halomonas sp. PAMB 3232]